ncbi:hypothetical protein NE237_002647 [Protea cynaroides]|uniref:Uncharacterized protein n=1 Tax=Protea cynaroides TaxID=273540 RepID=A0A9Q0JS96_9MAGN|nr:hypothetical protein NE237_002647 [Protea cynaroides]
MFNHLFVFVYTEPSVISFVPILDIPISDPSVGETFEAARDVPPERRSYCLWESKGCLIEDTLRQDEGRPAIVVAAAAANVAVSSTARGGSSGRPTKAHKSIASRIGKGVEIFSLIGALNTRSSLWLKYSSLNAHVQCVAKEDAHSKVVNESGQKIVVLLEDVERLKAIVNIEKEVNQEAKLVQLQMIISDVKMARQKAEEDTHKTETKVIKAKAEVVRLLSELSSV